MPLTATTPPATDRQRAFLASLAAERDWADRLNGQEWETAQDSCIPDHFISKAEASAAISALLACPKLDRAPAPAPVAALGMLAGLPLSKYSLVEAGVRTFWEVKEYRGTRYLRLLVGAPGEFNRTRVGLDRARAVAQELRRDPAAAALAFAQHYTCCAVCGADLSDETSVALGLGPVCRQRFGL